MARLTIQLSEEDSALVERVFATGLYESREDVLSAALFDLRLDHEPGYAEWLSSAVETGIEDVAAGRVTPARDALQRVRESISQATAKQTA